jgi:hypothetical protein
MGQGVRQGGMVILGRQSGRRRMSRGFNSRIQALFAVSCTMGKKLEIWGSFKDDSGRN